jgi:hypothetical protein
VRKAARNSASAKEALSAWMVGYERAIMTHPTVRRRGWQAQIPQLVLHSGINVYMIVTLEQIVTRNRVGEEEREWTFGQVLAVFPLLGVVMEVGNVLLPKVISRLGGERSGDEECLTLDSVQ